MRTAWREVGAYPSWDQADIIRLATQRDTPALDVRVRFERGLHVVEISEVTR